MSEETVTFNLELNVEQCMSNIRQLEGLMYRTLGLVRRFGLPEDVNEAISMIQRLVMSIRILHTSIILLQAATGPIGWAKALVGAAVGAVSIGEFLYDTSRGT